MKKTISLLLITLIACACIAQDLSGNWEGFIKKTGNDTPYQYALSLTKKEGSYQGQSLIKYFDQNWYCTNHVVGERSGDFFFYAHRDFIEHVHERGAFWLMPRGTLRYDPIKEKLVGWVDAYDPHTNSISKRHDYVELYRKTRLVNNVPSLPTIAERK